MVTGNIQVTPKHLTLDVFKVFVSSAMLLYSWWILLPCSWHCSFFSARLRYVLHVLLLYGGRIQGSAALMHCGLNWAYCAPLDLVPPVISTGAPRPTTWETYVSVGGKYGRGNGRFNFAHNMRLTRYVYGSFTCRKVTTRDRRLYFSSDGRHAEDLFRFARKIRRLQPGVNPRTWVPEASMLTNKPLKPLRTACNSQACFIVLSPLLSVTDTICLHFYLSVSRPGVGGI
jgi:hypothetical protein